MVRAIEQRAEKWYRQQDANNPEVVAELVYYRLRKGDLSGARAAWRDGCAIHLANAEDDLKGKAKAWLKARTRSASGQSGDEIAEARAAQTADRIRELRARGHTRAIQNIIGVGDRVANIVLDPLVFQVAYEARLHGERERALELLERAGTAPGPVGRDRAVLRALLLAEKGEAQAAGEILASISDAEIWANRRFGDFELLAVHAARIRLAVNLELEAQAIRSETFSGPGLLSPMDIVSPELLSKLSVAKPEATVGLEPPVSPEEFPRFAAEIEKSRIALRGTPRSPLRGMPSWQGGSPSLRIVAGQSSPPRPFWPRFVSGWRPRPIPSWRGQAASRSRKLRDFRGEFVRSGPETEPLDSEDPERHQRPYLGRPDPAGPQDCRGSSENTHGGRLRREMGQPAQPLVVVHGDRVHAAVGHRASEADLRRREFHLFSRPARKPCRVRGRQQ